MSWWKRAERKSGDLRCALTTGETFGMPALDARSRELYEKALPRGVLLPALKLIGSDQSLDAAA